MLARPTEYSLYPLTIDVSALAHQSPLPRDPGTPSPTKIPRRVSQSIKPPTTRETTHLRLQHRNLSQPCKAPNRRDLANTTFFLPSFFSSPHDQKTKRHLHSFLFNTCSGPKEKEENRADGIHKYIIDPRRIRTSTRGPHQGDCRGTVILLSHSHFFFSFFFFLLSPFHTRTWNFIR